MGPEHATIEDERLRRYANLLANASLKGAELYLQGSTTERLFPVMREFLAFGLSNAWSWLLIDRRAVAYEVMDRLLPAAVQIVVGGQMQVEKLAADRGQELSDELSRMTATRMGDYAAAPDAAGMMSRFSRHVGLAAGRSSPAEWIAVGMYVGGFLKTTDPAAHLGH